MIEGLDKAPPQRARRAGYMRTARRRMRDEGWCTASFMVRLDRLAALDRKVAELGARNRSECLDHILAQHLAADANPTMGEGDDGLANHQT